MFCCSAELFKKISRERFNCWQRENTSERGHREKQRTEKKQSERKANAGMKKDILCAGYDKGWTKQIKCLHLSSLLFNEVQSCQQKRKCHQMSATE